MLQNELKSQLRKSQSQNKLMIVLTAVCLLSTLVFGLLYFSQSNDTDDFKQLDKAKINQPPPLQVRNIPQDTIIVQKTIAEGDIRRKFDSLTYIIDTLKLSLVKSRAQASRDYERYVTASNYTPEPTEEAPVKIDNITYLIENAQKNATTDCGKALAFLYAAQKIAQIDGTSTTNKTTINEMMSKCEDELFNN